MRSKTVQIDDLRLRREEVEETLRQIRKGGVDAVVVREKSRERIYAIRDAEHVYRFLIESVEQGAVLLDREGTILFLNGRFARMLGRSVSTLLGARMSDLVPEPRTRALARLLREGGACEMGLLTKSGKVLHARVSVRVAERSRGAQISFVVTEPSDELQRAREEIAARDEFISIASHELFNPIAALQLGVQGLTRLLKHGDRRATPERILEVLESTQSQCRRLQKLVHGLLDVTQIRSGHLRLQKEPMDLAEETREIVAQVASQAESAGSTIHLEAEPAVGKWDRVRIGQVVSNLLSNAVKFGRGRPIRVEVCRSGARAVLRVQDRGAGIPHEQQNRIWEPFRRGRSTAPGLGLGLYVVKQIVEAHGGDVRVESAPHAGAIFTVHLPLDGRAS